MTGWAVRLAGTALALAFAWAAVGSALDRAAINDPRLAAMVPSEFRVRSMPAFIAGQDVTPQAAVGPMMQAVAADPVDYRLLSAFGSSLMLSGQDDAAFNVFRASAALGWRDRLTQAYWMQVALDDGEWDMAALRLDALLRARPDLDQADPLLAPFENDPAGRKVLAGRLALEPTWLPTYLTGEGDIPDAALLRRVPVLQQLAQDGHVLGCPRVAGLVRSLVARGQAEQASLLQVAHCPGAATLGGLGAPRFDRKMIESGADPFGWRKVPSANLVVRDGPDGALELSNSGSVAVQALARPVLFPSGSTVTVAIDGASASLDDIGLAIDCGKPTRPAFGGGATRTLPVPDCANQTLRLWLAARANGVVVKGLAQAR